MESIVIETDDDKSMNSKLICSVDKSLGRIMLRHEKQFGGTELVQVYPQDVDKLIEFLTKSKEWIQSGYKDKVLKSKQNGK